ncbi:hypothetical protein CYMTET_28597, partial [Cymbomonas tetramitiformis]
CYNMDDSGALGDLAAPERICQLDAMQSVTDGRTCPSNQECAYYGANPNSGTNGFDNMLLALYTIFQAITLEGWIDQAYFLIDAGGPITIMYHLALVFVGAYVIMNLALAVIYDSYTNCKEKVEMQEEAEEEMREIQTVEQAQQQERAVISFIVAKFMSKRDHDLDEEESERNPFLEAPSGTVGEMGPQQAALVSEAEKRFKSNVENYNTITDEMKEAGRSQLKMWVLTSFKRASHFVEKVQNDGAASMRQAIDVSQKQSATGEWLHQQSKPIVEHRFFQHAITGLILISTLLLFADHYRAPELFHEITHLVNLISSSIFALEMVLMLFNLGPRAYFTSFYTTLDFFVVVTSWMEIILSMGGGLVVLRLFRLMRLSRTFRFIKRWHALQIFMKALRKTIGSILPFLVLMCMFVLVMALFGKYCFQDTYSNNRFNFNTLFWAMVSTFQVMSGENWADTLTDAVAANGWSAAFFFLFVYIIGNMVVFNIFSAILINSYSTNEVKVKANQKDLDAAVNTVAGGDVYEDSDDEEVEAEERMREQRPSIARFRLTSTNVRAIRVEEPEEANSLMLSGRSFFIFDVDNGYRRWITRIVQSSSFNTIILALIVFSSVLLALDSPDLDNNSQLGLVLIYCSYVLAVIFAIEMLMKMVAMGALLGEGAYARDPWNLIDGFVVCVSILGIVFHHLTFLRALRALRPLRIIIRMKGFKFVVETITISIRQSMATIAVACFVMLAIAAIGVQLFAGAFYHCNDASIDNADDCTGAFEDSDDAEEAWPDIMLAGVDAVGQRQAMRKDANIAHAVYFLASIMILNVFFLNMIIGVVVECANDLKETTKYPTLGPILKEWILSLKDISRTKPVRHETSSANKIQRELAILVSSVVFEKFIYLAIMANCVVMTITYHGESAQYKQTLVSRLPPRALAKHSPLPATSYTPLPPPSLQQLPAALLARLAAGTSYRYHPLPSSKLPWPSLRASLLSPAYPLPPSLQQLP